MKVKKHITAGLMALVAICANAQEGAWSGKLAVQGMDIPLVFHFNADGCTLDSPAEGAKGIKAEKSFTEDGKLRISIPSIGAMFEGYMIMKSITGTFTQRGAAFPLSLIPGDLKANRPQTPVPPFPYSTEEVSFTNDGFTFNGTLTLPKAYTNDTPVLLMVTGSGQQNRDEELFEHKPFAVLADALAREGIATLRYDDRGFGDKNVDFSSYTTADFKNDAEAGIQILRKRFNKVGIVGHSEGGTIALMLASEGKVDFAVSLAGMAVSARETLLMQNRITLENAGFPTDKVAQYIGAIDNVFVQLSEGKSLDSISKNEYIPIEMRPVIDQAVKNLSSNFMRYFITLNIGPLLSNIKCPVLAMNGSLDKQVECASNLETIDKGLINSKHKVIAVEGANHLLQTCKTGNTIEYQQIEETISPIALNDIKQWIKSTIINN